MTTQHRFNTGWGMVGSINGIESVETIKNEPMLFGADLEFAKHRGGKLTVNAISAILEEIQYLKKEEKDRPYKQRKKPEIGDDVFGLNFISRGIADPAVLIELISGDDGHYWSLGTWSVHWIDHMLKILITAKKRLKDKERFEEINVYPYGDGVPFKEIVFKQATGDKK